MHTCITHSISALTSMFNVHISPATMVYGNPIPLYHLFAPLRNRYYVRQFFAYVLAFRVVREGRHMLPFATDRVLCERASEAARRKGTVKPIHDGRGGFGTIPVPPAVGGGDDVARGKSLVEQQVRLPTLHKLYSV